jgi:AIPR protein
VSASEHLPEYLQDFSSFTEHLRQQFEPLGNVEKGDAFLQFSLRLLPFTRALDQFRDLEPSPNKSHDDGVDFKGHCTDRHGELCGQSKYRITRVEDLDSIFSKFANYESAARQAQPQGELFIDASQGASPLTFAIVTSSELTSLLQRFEKRNFASKPHLDRWRAEGHFITIQGQDLFRALVDVYRRTFVLPLEVEIELASAPIQHGKVLLSAIRVGELRAAYESHGASLFFENIREFLGVATRGDRDAVNHEILRTLKDAPERMLERNNGVVFRADSISKMTETRYALKAAGIVNGCQTTMCAVTAGPVADNALVPIKIVGSDDAWEIAKAANFQNTIYRIDLELARFLRPQLARRVALEVGYAMPKRSDENVANILETIHREQVSYDEVRLLALGVFSRTPNNLFAVKHAELRLDILACVHDAGENPTVLRTLFLLLRESQKAIEKLREVFTEEEYADLFRRFFRPDKPIYRCYLALLAAAGFMDYPLQQKDTETQQGYTALMSFLGKLEAELLTNSSLFQTHFNAAFEVLADKILDLGRAGSDDQILQQMYRTVSDSDFRTLFRKQRVKVKLHRQT